MKTQNSNETKAPVVIDLTKTTEPVSSKVNREAARKQVAQNLFANLTEVSFLSSAAPISDKLVAGEELEISGHKLSASNPKSAACSICGGTHGVKRGRIQDSRLFAQTLIFRRKNGSIFFISNSGSDGCFEKYARPLIKADALEGIDRLRQVVGGFKVTPPPAPAPVKK